MTTPDTATDELQAQPAPNPADLANELLALTMLASRVKATADVLREQIRKTWQPGTKIVAALPNPDDPRLPYKVGEVRCDAGPVTVTATDPAAFTAWATENAREHVVIEPARCATPATPPAHLAALLGEVFDAALRRCSGPFAEPAAEVLWELLRTSGWTLAPVEHIPERTVVQPGYIAAVLDLSKRQLEPCAPGGLIPAGITVDVADPKPFVLPTKDAALVEAFVTGLAHQLPLPAATALALDGMT